VGFIVVSKTPKQSSVDTDLDRAKVRQVQSYGASIDGKDSPCWGDVRIARLCSGIIRVVPLKVVPCAVNSDVPAPAHILRDYFSEGYPNTWITTYRTGIEQWRSSSWCSKTSVGRQPVVEVR
jgi:hypothetical protein